MVAHTIDLDYPANPRVRYGWGAPAHSGLSKIISAGMPRYKETIWHFLRFVPNLVKITSTERDAQNPYWLNEWFPAWDGVALYGFLATRKPRRYVEIGSGVSTKFARRAIKDHRLSTGIFSIDPFPRAEINDLCTEIIRQPLEDVPLDFFADLTSEDVLFFDGSHRALQNSDATVFFTEILPRLKPGLLVGVHDIFLPHDYPPDWALRFYSEQYLLACWLLAGERIKVELPVYFSAEARELHSLLSPLWAHPNLAGANHSGGTFWFTCR